MKCFLAGFAGFFLAAAATATLYVLYSDYRAAVSISNAMAAIGSMRTEIRDVLVDRGAKANVGAKLKPPAEKRTYPDIDYLRVMPEGTIVFRGAKYGQIIVLEPTLRGGEVAWKCTGSKPDKNIPRNCR